MSWLKFHTRTVCLQLSAKRRSAYQLPTRCKANNVNRAGVFDQHHCPVHQSLSLPEFRDKLKMVPDLHERYDNISPRFCDGNAQWSEKLNKILGYAKFLRCTLGISYLRYY